MDGQFQGRAVPLQSSVCHLCLVLLLLRRIITYVRGVLCSMGRQVFRLDEVGPHELRRVVTLCVEACTEDPQLFVSLLKFKRHIKKGGGLRVC